MIFQFELTEQEMRIFEMCIMKAPIPREVSEPLVQSINRQIGAAQEKAAGGSSEKDKGEPAD